MFDKIHIRLLLSAAAIIPAVLTAGCSAERSEPGETEKTESVEAAAPAQGATGDTITIEMITDATGNYFKPKRIEAHPGDVLHYVLTVGVHNVHFLPDSNSIKTGLPPASELLQLPGQSYDLVVSMQPGKYYFQCDPHAALGMTGHLEVEKRD